MSDERSPGDVVALAADVDARDPSSLADFELMKRHRAGDDTAFAELVDRHHGWVHGYLRTRLGADADAADLTQEVFLRAFRGAGGFRFRARFSSWLFRITENVRKRHVTRLARARRRASEERDGGDRAIETAEDARPGPDAVAESRDDLRRVRRALVALPERQQRAIVLSCIEGLSTAAVADLMGVPVGTVKTLVHRGRLRLAERLARGVAQLARGDER